MKRKITGFMIWNFDHLELIEAIYNDKKLEEIFEKSKKTQAKFLRADNHVERH